MLVLLATLLYIYVRLSNARPGSDRNQEWFVQLPFSIYLGWISVATIANISQVLFYSGWNGWGISATAWTAIMLAVATFLGLMMQWREKDDAYALVLIWAFIGIALKHADTSSVAYPAWTAVAILAIGLLSGVLLRRGRVAQGA